MMATFCQSCGGGLALGARFCSRCGSQVAAAQPVPGRPLIRPRIGRQIGGVCIALANAHGWDVTLVRVLVVLAFVFSSGLVGVAYLAAWIGIPEEPLPFPGAYPPQV
jgi:phage shock protein PspC (stress-responsive transcriptional regulator)